ncbi:uncharacterized protein LOC129962316 [Argiope bruennichi]|uniref:uncharacterized protein LOC129962316 n=1 Tax=Argiope bruennichi TaxID=94029 RepID=UPI002494E5CC|nr:uncharacterized protein LOC129962316 [Argiope bruennichi]
MQINKSHMGEQQVRAFALSTIENKYPRDTWLHVNIDGSMLNDEDGAGVGVACDLFSYYAPIGAHSTHYDVKIEAIYIALKQLAIRPSSFCRAVISSDSLSALQSLANRQCTDNTRIKECRELSTSMSVPFQWIPAHYGNPENEATDFFAKKGPRVVQRPLKSLSFHSVKLLIKRK